MGFTRFGLSDHIMQGVRAVGHSVPTPIQSLAIEPALAGRDVIGCAQTGTGKTAAFVLPILQRLTENGRSPSRDGHPRALVLTPTRELAQQVQSAVTNYGRFLTLRAVSIYGGASMDNQLKLLRRGADIVVATPGRLLDHLERGTIQLSKVEILVLDEADRMLDMGFIRDVRSVVDRVPANRQTMLFSATISDDINNLAAGMLRDPLLVEAGAARKPAETVTQHFYAARREAKLSLLLETLSADGMDSVLVFSRTKHGADKICRNLERRGVTSAAIHSNRSQSQRERALDGFKRGSYRVLVATDIAARGIDVNGISHVVNYDIPAYPEDYVHRIGRTGRAGATGDAITFVCSDEHQYLKRIERFTGKSFPLIQDSGASAILPPNSGDERRKPNFEPHRPPDAGGKPRARRKKRAFVTPPRKRKAPKRMDSFSSDHGGAGWSNY